LKQFKELERLAVDAHARGESWIIFWERHGNDIKAVYPWNRARLRRLIDRLLHLLTCGDVDGMESIDAPCPWLTDDNEANKPADVGTQARFDWARLSGNKEVMA
jgi:hypothetical protein